MCDVKYDEDLENGKCVYSVVQSSRHSWNWMVVPFKPATQGNNEKMLGDLVIILLFTCRKWISSAMPYIDGKRNQKKHANCSWK